MSDEEHQFESKADAGASKTYPQQAGTIRKGGHIVIKNRACKVVEVSTSKTGKHGHAKCHFVAIDIFNGKKLEDIVPSSHNCDVPHVSRTDYQLIDISEDGFVSLLTENGNTKDDLKLPTDDALLTQVCHAHAIHQLHYVNSYGVVIYMMFCCITKSITICFILEKITKKKKKKNVMNFSHRYFCCSTIFSHIKIVVF
ncbi:putative ribosomal protein L2, domain 2 [Helianthus annuus]|nr:putative ribosomal protein L2, domain 2 [Helianthus annuus]